MHRPHVPRRCALHGALCCLSPAVRGMLDGARQGGAAASHRVLGAARCVGCTSSARTALIGTGKCAGRPPHPRSPRLGPSHPACRGRELNGEWYRVPGGCSMPRRVRHACGTSTPYRSGGGHALPTCRACHAVHSSGTAAAARSQAGSARTAKVRRRSRQRQNKQPSQGRDLMLFNAILHAVNFTPRDVRLPEAGR